MKLYDYFVLRNDSHVRQDLGSIKSINGVNPFDLVWSCIKMNLNQDTFTLNSYCEVGDGTAEAQLSKKNLYKFYKPTTIEIGDTVKSCQDKMVYKVGKVIDKDSFYIAGKGPSWSLCGGVLPNLIYKAEFFILIRKGRNHIDTIELLDSIAEVI